MLGIVFDHTQGRARFRSGNLLAEDLEHQGVGHFQFVKRGEG